MEDGKSVDEIFDDQFLVAAQAAARALDPALGNQTSRVEREVTVGTEDDEQRVYTFIGHCTVGPESMHGGDLLTRYSISSQVTYPIDGRLAPPDGLAKMLEGTNARVMIDTEYSIDTDEMRTYKSQVISYVLNEESSVGHVDLTREASTEHEVAPFWAEEEDELYKISTHTEAQEVNEMLAYLGFLGHYINLDERVG